MADTFTVHAHQDETIDALVWRALGAGPELVGEVLNLNRGLADLGTVLPEGYPVILPVVRPAPVGTLDIVQLW